MYIACYYKEYYPKKLEGTIWLHIVNKINRRKILVFFKVFSVHIYLQITWLKLNQLSSKLSFFKFHFGEMIKKT